MPALTVNDMIGAKLLDELARVVGVEGQEKTVFAWLDLDPIRVGAVPGGPDAAGTYWLRVCRELANGAMIGEHRLERLLGAAHTLYPGNNLFARYKDYAPHARGGPATGPEDDDGSPSTFGDGGSIRHQFPKPGIDFDGVSVRLQYDITFVRPVPPPSQATPTSDGQGCAIGDATEMPGSEPRDGSPPELNGPGVPGTALTVRDMIRKRLITELANTAVVGGDAEMILALLAFPSNRIPPAADTPQTFWLKLCNLIAGGAIRGEHRLERLLGAAHLLFPENALFVRFQEYAPVTAGQGDSAGRVAEVPARVGGHQGESDIAHLPPSAGRLDDGAVIRVDGGGTRQVIAVAQQVAAGHQPPVRVMPAMSGEGFVLFHAPDLEFEAALALAEVIRAEMARQGQQVRVYAANREARDYLIGQAFAEGPDQDRFALNDIRGSTTVEAVARAVMAQYDPKMWGQDHQGQLLPSVVEHATPYGSKRLDPDTTLTDANVQDGDTLQVHPETIAG